MYCFSTWTNSITTAAFHGKCLHVHSKKERQPRNGEWFALKRENKHKRDLHPQRQTQQVKERAMSLPESHVDSDLDKEEISTDGWETNSKTLQRRQHWCVATIAAVIVNTIAQCHHVSVRSSTCFAFALKSEIGRRTTRARMPRHSHPSSFLFPWQLCLLIWRKGERYGMDCKKKENVNCQSSSDVRICWNHQMRAREETQIETKQWKKSLHSVRQNVSYSGKSPSSPCVSPVKCSLGSQITLVCEVSMQAIFLKFVRRNNEFYLENVCYLPYFQKNCGHTHNNWRGLFTKTWQFFSSFIHPCVWHSKPKRRYCEECFSCFCFHFWGSQKQKSS